MQQDKISEESKLFIFPFAAQVGLPGEKKNPTSGSTWLDVKFQHSQPGDLAPDNKGNEISERVGESLG